jgi:tetratricopeptide (TPR) repeat protein
MANIFISYTGSDRDWAFWIAKELEAQGHTPHVHEWEIARGGDIYAWMEQRHDAADHVLCVVSDDYLKAPYATLERNAAMWQATAKRPGFVLFVAVKPCRLPTLADHIRRCELFGMPEDAARLRFREFMGQRATAAAAAFPGKVFAVSNIPIRVPEHFLGRDDALTAIDAALRRYEGRVAITALHGLRGVGKTTLAAAYAERHRGDYRATWWIRAQNESTTRADLVGLGVRLGWVAADAEEEPALAAVMERLRHEGEGILLILDNAIDADGLKPYLPRGGAAQVLVTSNTHAWRGVAAPVEIRLWPSNIGADYLIARTGRTDERAAAANLSEALGGLPLAHEQTAAYCERLEISLAEYAKRFAAAPAKLLDAERDAPAEYHDRLTVAKTFALAIDEAVKLYPAAEPLIVHAALLAPEPIPLFLFSEAREKFGEPLASALEGDGLDEAVAALRAFALVNRETIADERDPAITTDCIRLHRLVRQVAQARRDGEGYETARRTLIEAMAAVYPEVVWDDPRSWPRARRLDALSVALVGRDAMLPKGTEKSAADILMGAAIYRWRGLAAYAQAEPLYEHALEIRETVLGPEHPDTAASLNNLAFLLIAKGDRTGARALCDRAVAISEHGLGAEDRDAATSLMYFATLLSAMGDLTQARALFERVLAIRDKVLGPEHLDAVTSLCDLGVVLQKQGNSAEARQLFERALAICDKVLGSEHPDTAYSIICLAYVLQDQGDLAGARPLFERVLRINEKAFGLEHSRTVRSLNSLAELLQTQGDLAAAQPLFERVLAIREKLLGPEHPDTAMSLNQLARLRLTQGDLAAAQPLFERALGIFEKVLGPEHPNTNRGRCNFARLHLAKRQAVDALSLGEIALAAHDKALGLNHRWTKDSAGVTADALAALARAEEANALREKYGIAHQAG